MLLPGYLKKAENQRHCRRDWIPVEVKAAVISLEGINPYSSWRSEKSAKLPPQLSSCLLNQLVDERIRNQTLL